MDNKIVNEKLQQLHTMFKNMRKFQKDFFRYKAQSDLNNAKYLERKADKLSDEIDQIINSKQPELFT